MEYESLIIDALLEAGAKPVSGEELAGRLGISRTAVWKHIRALQREGYHIEVLRGRGYALKRLSSRPLEREVRRGLSTRRFGKRVIYYERVGSTNDVARELARQGAEEGTVVIAGEQTRGRGRLDRSWESPEGGVFLSLIVRPHIPPAAISRLSLLAGLAAAKAAESFSGVPIGLKWPNDLMVDDRKVGGVLCEMEGEAERVDFAIVGIGIDANCDVSVDIPTTSLKKEAGAAVDITGLIREVLRVFENLYEGFLRGAADFLEDYKERSQTLGKDVKILQPKREIAGKAVDIDGEGALVLRLRDGSYERVLSGDCIHLR